MPESIWAALDRLLAQHKRALAETKARIKELGGGYVRVDDFGRWRCSFRVTWGKAKGTRKLTARNGAELVAKVEQLAAERPKRKEPAREG